MAQSHKADWVSYAVVVLYLTLLIGCIIGIRRNSIKKRALLAKNTYEKQQRVIRWKYRFYLTLMVSVIVRIISIISALELRKTMVLTKADNYNEFVWSAIGSIASMLFFSSFSSLVWFFAALTFHSKDSRYKRLITPFFTALNVIIYTTFISIIICSFAVQSYHLLYDYELPLFAVCGLVLAVCFIVLSFKIASSIQRERNQTVEYIEHSRRVSITHTQSRQYSVDRHQSPIPIFPIAPNNTAPNINGADNAMGESNTNISQIISRLIKLSLLCALCWGARSLYLMSLRLWESTDRTPFNIPELAWEAIFYCFMEYPPSLGAIYFCVSKPKVSKGPSISLQNQKYPQAGSDY